VVALEEHIGRFASGGGAGVVLRFGSGFDVSLRLTGQLAPYQGTAGFCFGFNTASAGTVVTVRKFDWNGEA
jgi:hypothetical protein